MRIQTVHLPDAGEIRVAVIPFQAGEETWLFERVVREELDRRLTVPPDPKTRAVNGNTPTGAALARAIGAPNSICITPGPNQVMFVGESTFPGRIFKVSLEGKVIGVIGRSGRRRREFSGAHALACPSDKEIYAAETSNWRVQKLILK